MSHFIQLLTYFRIIAGPIIFALILVSQNFGAALLIFLLASSTDYWDGYLARKYSLTSELGAVLDPIADKILMILAREFWVGALRDLNARADNIQATEVTFLAKTKTFTQLVTLCLFLLGLVLSNSLIIFIANFFLFLAFIITMKTGLSYTIATFKK
jgi:phosphatidylglycerophosphate synthase